MQNPATQNVQELSCLDDLDLLKPGDVVPITYRHMPSSDGELDYLGIYHGKSSLGQLQFLVPAKMSEEYIIMYRAHRQRIRIEGGKVTLNEDESVEESFSQTNPAYSGLNSTLTMSGLR